MERNFFDPPIEEIEIVLVARATIKLAQRQIGGCETCRPVDAEIPFDWILDRMTGSDSALTDYLMEVPARCSYCRRQITEKTLVVALSFD
jgi:hypothetical protein